MLAERVSHRYPRPSVPAPDQSVLLPALWGWGEGGERVSVNEQLINGSRTHVGCSLQAGGFPVTSDCQSSPGLSVRAGTRVAMAIFQHPSSEPEGTPAPCTGSGPLAHRLLCWGQRQELRTLPPTLTPRPATPPVGSPGGKAGSGMIELQLVSLFLAALCKWLHLNVT